MSSEESTEYRPSSSSSADVSESSPGGHTPRVEIRPKPQRDEGSAESEAASDSEDSGSLVPVFSEWKAAQRARKTESPSTALVKKHSSTPSSSEEEDDARPPRRQVRPGTPMSTRGRPIVVSSDDE